MIQLNLVEARVLGSLMEKEVTTPENYPLSLNALVNACNQQSSREPVMELRESDVRTALFDMEQRALTRTLTDSRVSKFENRVREALSLKRDEFAVICLLLLRGPQTTAELRARAERMYTFDDNAAVAGTLERLAARTEPLAPLTVLLQRQPGAREARWMHLLCGPVDNVATGPYTDAASEARRASAPRSATVDNELLQRIEFLEEALQAAEERLRAVEEKLLAFEGFAN